MSKRSQVFSNSGVAFVFTASPIKSTYKNKFLSNGNDKITYKIINRVHKKST